MKNIQSRTKFVAAAVGTMIGGLAAPALLFLGAGTAQAIQDVNEFAPDITVGIDDPGILPPLVDDPGIKVGIVDPGLRVGIGGPDTRPQIIDPGIKVGVIDPGLRVGIGGPDTRPQT